MNPISLLEINDEYLQASWSIPSSEMQAIAIYRTNEAGWFALEQVRGPWSIYDPVLEEVIDETEGDEYKEAALVAVALLNDVNIRGVEFVKASFAESGGTVYDL